MCLSTMQLLLISLAPSVRQRTKNLRRAGREAKLCRCHMWLRLQGNPPVAAKAASHSVHWAQDGNVRHRTDTIGHVPQPAPCTARRRNMQFTTAQHARWADPPFGE